MVGYVPRHCLGGRNPRRGSCGICGSGGGIESSGSRSRREGKSEQPEDDFEQLGDDSEHLLGDEFEQPVGNVSPVPPFSCETLLTKGLLGSD